MQRITFAGLMEKMARMPEVIEAEMVKGLTKSAVQVHKTAVEKFGEYQPDHGPFNAWDILADMTLEQKQRAGSTNDDPLIGHYVGKRNRVYPVPLRQSLTMHVDKEKLVAQVGTNDPIGEWQEFGTGHIPPRPFLRPALYQNEDWIKKTMKESVGLGMWEVMRV